MITGMYDVCVCVCVRVCVCTYAYTCTSTQAMERNNQLTRTIARSNPTT